MPDGGYGAPNGGASGGYVAPAAQMTPQPPAVQQTPGLPPVPPEQKKSGSAKPIIIGVIAAVLLAGVGVGVFVLRPRFMAKSTPSASASSARVAQATASESPPPPPPPPPPTTPASTTASAEVDAGAPAEKLELTLICTPQCDELLVDNEKIEKLEEKNKVQVLPGKHTVEARKTGFVTFKETIDIEKPVEKELKLAKIGTALPPPPKKCGKFLKCK
jgi:hypothetical protein